ncbi:MAG: patatin [Dehalococcoidia bacterium]|nr:patatin [Dehalococcoidia bacterium]
MSDAEKVYRILAIDGGGMKGLFPASFLATIEDSIGDSVSNYFDLIVGTSTGGIIALGLGAGLPAGEIADFYESIGPPVFGKPRNRLARIFASKYQSKPLRTALESVIGAKKLGDSKARLVIPSVDLDTGEVYIYKTAHLDRFERDHKVSMIDVALAATAAPSYFPAHSREDGVLLVDGGVWANNPVGLAAVEAVGVLGWEPERVRILSLGCTRVALDAGKARRLSGLLAWGQSLTIINVIFAAQSSASIGTAQHLVGHQNVMRIDPVVPAGRYDLDKTTEVRALRALGASQAREALPGLRPAFFAMGHVEPFQPYRMLEPASAP